MKPTMLLIALCISGLMVHSQDIESILEKFQKQTENYHRVFMPT